MYQKLQKVPDNLLSSYFELLTNLDLETLPEHPRDRQEFLAFNVVAQYHGESAAKQAADDSRKLSSGKTEDVTAVPEFSLFKRPVSCKIILYSWP